MHRLGVYQCRDIGPIMDAVTLALTESGKRSGGRNPVAAVAEVIRRSMENERAFALWVAIDEDMRKEAKPLNDCVAGVMTLDVRGDDVGNPVAWIGLGWVRKGYAAEPFDRALPHAEKWALARGCRKLITCTERSSAGRNGDRLEEATGRVRGLMAYWKWIGKRNFVMRETLFERQLN